MAKDLAAQIELGRSFHQEGTVNEKVCDSYFVHYKTTLTCRGVMCALSRLILKLNSGLVVEV